MDNAIVANGSTKIKQNVGFTRLYVGLPIFFLRNNIPFLMLIS